MCGINHCHDGSFPTINCFETVEERDRDVAAVVDASASLAAPSGETIAADVLDSTSCVTFWKHANYGGYSFTAPVDRPPRVLWLERRHHILQVVQRAATQVVGTRQLWDPKLAVGDGSLGRERR